MSLLFLLIKIVWNGGQEVDKNTFFKNVSNTNTVFKNFAMIIVQDFAKGIVRPIFPIYFAKSNIRMPTHSFESYL